MNDPAAAHDGPAPPAPADANLPAPPAPGKAEAGNDGPARHPAETDDGLSHTLSALHAHLERLEHLVAPETRAVHTVQQHYVKPAWQRAGEGEHRVPVIIAVSVAVFLEVTLPSRLDLGPSWLLPALEGALGVGLTIANPTRIDRESRALRMTSLTLIASISIANAWSAGKLIDGLLDGGRAYSDAVTLLRDGGAIYLTNVIAFGLWYWELDRGGPAARVHGERSFPDFLFPQMDKPELAPPTWRPIFVDYLYTSFTNATAFSPTDVMPLSRWSKALFALQSAVSLLTVALVIARAVNIFS